MGAKSVHTVVTSPPYFGLRDYGHDGQIGLESSPDDFVAAMIEVFRSVRRVLRDEGAHFATFPPDLIEPCVLAGSPVGGTVYDPFGGSGTTAVVALKHGRNAILSELNPEYVILAQERIKAGV